MQIGKVFVHLIDEFTRSLFLENFWNGLFPIAQDSFKLCKIDLTKMNFIKTVQNIFVEIDAYKKVENSSIKTI